MNPFVNLNKRDFLLPGGCKDLIDVLEPSRQRRKASDASASVLPSVLPPVIREDRFPTAGLAQIGHYVSMLLQSRGHLFTLMVAARDDEFPVVLYRSESEKTVAIALLAKDAHREKGVRAFFDRQGIGPLLDYLAPDASAPDACRGLVYPLPRDATRATELTTELLRSVFSLSEEAGLDFRYYEMGTTV